MRHSLIGSLLEAEAPLLLVPCRLCSLSVKVVRDGVIFVKNKINVEVDEDGYIFEDVSSENGKELLRISRFPDGRIMNIVEYDYKNGQCSGWRVKDGGGEIVRKFRVFSKGGLQVFEELDCDDNILSEGEL